MTHFNAFSALLCKNCSHAIQLPLATHPETSQGRGSWPTGGHLKNFLCPVCKHVYEYSAQDVDSLSPETHPRAVNTPYNVVCIELECDAKNCGSLVRIRTVMEFDKDPRAEAPGMLAKGTAHAIRCDRGDILNGPLAPFAEAFDAYFDEDWETG